MQTSSPTTEARTLEVVVPTGAFGGAVIQVLDPQTNSTRHVRVPLGLQPGMKFFVDLPPVPDFKSNTMLLNNNRWSNNLRRPKITAVLLDAAYVACYAVL